MAHHDADQQTNPRRHGLEGEQRREPASGQKAGPPGSGERDHDLEARQIEQLEQAGGGH
ncbi:MAG TPA: hypothetical protein VD931_04355 [Baekduia sp.]|nr:hypothetical protein [Baekduia sp.]